MTFETETIFTVSTWSALCRSMQGKLIWGNDIYNNLKLRFMLFPMKTPHLEVEMGYILLNGIFLLRGFKYKLCGNDAWE